MILTLITLLPTFARTGSGPSHQGKGDSFPLDGLARVDFSARVHCRGRFSHVSAGFIGEKTSIGLVQLRYWKLPNLPLMIN